MTKDEALKKAIDTLQNAKREHFYCEDTYYSCPKHEDGCADDRQPDECNCGADKLNAEIDISTNACKKALEQPAQEPVLYIDQSGLDGHATWAQAIACQDTDIALYTHPHQWQGLTDNEKLSSIRKWAENNTMRGQELIGLCDSIEQALKEKNT